MHKKIYIIGILWWCVPTMVETGTGCSFPALVDEAVIDHYRDEMVQTFKLQDEQAALQRAREQKERCDKLSDESSSVSNRPMIMSIPTMAQQQELMKKIKENQAAREALEQKQQNERDKRRAQRQETKNLSVGAARAAVAKRQRS